MSTIFSTDFESYADGTASIPSNGWSQSFGPTDAEVVSTFSHGGSKSVKLGFTVSGGNAIYRNVTISGRSASLVSWIYRPSGNAVGGGDIPPDQKNAGSIALMATASASEGHQGILANTLHTLDPTKIRLFVGNTLVTSSATGVIPASDAWYSLRLDVYLSSVNGTNDDVLEDGCIKVYANGVLVIDLAGVKAYTATTDWASGLNRVQMAYAFVEGYVDDFSVTDDAVACLSTSGSLCVGDQGTVVVPRAVLFSLNGSPNTNTTPGLFKIAGDLEVTGTATLDTVTSRLDGLGT